MGGAYPILNTSLMYRTFDICGARRTTCDQITKQLYRWVP